MGTPLNALERLSSVVKPRTKSQQQIVAAAGSFCFLEKFHENAACQSTARGHHTQRFQAPIELYDCDYEHACLSNAVYERHIKVPK